MKYFQHSTDGVISHYFTEDHKFSFTDEGSRYDRMMEGVNADPPTNTIEEVDDTPVLTYADNRRGAYASWGDQLDMQYHDSVDGTTTWKDHVASVKSAHPKP
jgi:hypothetical protein